MRVDSSWRDAAQTISTLWRLCVFPHPSFSMPHHRHNRMMQRLTDQHLGHILGRAGASLRELDIRRAPRLSKAGLAPLGAVRDSLQSLVLSDCAGLGCDALDALRGLTRLEHLDISAMRFLGIEEELGPLQTLTSLRSLDLSECNYVSCGMIYPNIPRSLRSLQLTGCPGIHDAEELRDLCAKITMDAQKSALICNGCQWIKLECAELQTQHAAGPPSCVWAEDPHQCAACESWHCCDCRDRGAMQCERCDSSKEGGQTFLCKDCVPDYPYPVPPEVFYCAACKVTMCEDCNGGEAEQDENDVEDERLLCQNCYWTSMELQSDVSSNGGGTASDSADGSDSAAGDAPFPMHYA